MPTLAEIRSSIRRQVKGHFVTDDDRLRDLFLDKLIADKRMVLIGRDMDRGMGVDMGCYQIFDCLKIQCGQVTCEGLPSDEQYFYVDLPVTEHIAYLGSVDGSVSFCRTSLPGFLNALMPRLGGNQVVYADLNGQALLKFLPQGLEYVRLIAILYDPLNGGCRTLASDEPYPIANRMVHTLEVMCIQQLVSTLPIRPDTANNAQDDTKNPPIKTKNLQT